MSSSSLKRKETTDRDISPPPTKRKAATTTSTTSKAISNFFTPTSQKEPEKITFSTLHDTLFIARYESATSISRPKPLKIAAFDFDDTVVSTKSGNVFSTGGEDWKWWHASVPGKLKQLDKEGYAVLVVTNQSGVVLKPDSTKKKPTAASGEMKSLRNFKTKVAAVLKALDLPISVYAATGKDLFRKPRTGMWEQILKDYGEVLLLNNDDDSAGAGAADVDVDLGRSIFVGDAAGREGDKAAKIRKDHSCSDRDFAENVGIPFMTPEEYFLGEEARSFTRGFDPAVYLEPKPKLLEDSRTHATPNVSFVKKNTVEIVLFCGSPGAGKSTFYWQHLEPLGYARVNQDTLKTRDKCLKVAAQLLEGDDEHSSVVVDNTNADLETRAAWITLAKKLAVPIRLVHFTASAKLCEHNNTVRALADGLVNLNPEKRTLLPAMAFSSYSSRYREPKVEEGFEDITRVDFTFEGTEEQKAVWGKYWLS